MDWDNANLIDQVYDAALAESGWQGLLDRLGHEVHATWGALITQNSLTGVAKVHAAAGLDRGSRLAYEQYYGPITVFGRYTRDMPVGEVFTDHMHRDYDEYLKSEIFNDFFRPRGGQHQLFTNLRRSGLDRTYVCFRRDSAAGHYGDAEIRWFGRLAPHLSNALRIQDMVGAERRRSELFEDLLDRLSVGVILLDAGGRTVFMNAVAEAVVASADALLSRHGTVAAAHSEDRKGLQALIAGALPSGGPDAGGTMRLRRSSDRGDLEVTVVPLPPSRAEPSRGLGRGQSSVAIFLGEPLHGGGQLAEVLGALYHLTPAEARLTSALAARGSIREAACALGLAEQTARGYLKQIYAKTETKGQADLVRLVLNGPARFFG